MWKHETFFVRALKMASNEIPIFNYFGGHHLYLHAPSQTIPIDAESLKSVDLLPQRKKFEAAIQMYAAAPKNDPLHVDALEKAFDAIDSLVPHLRYGALDIIYTSAPEDSVLKSKALEKSLEAIDFLPPWSKCSAAINLYSFSNSNEGIRKEAFQEACDSMDQEPSDTLKDSFSKLFKHTTKEEKSEESLEKQQQALERYLENIDRLPQEDQWEAAAFIERKSAQNRDLAARAREKGLALIDLVPEEERINILFLFYRSVLNDNDKKKDIKDKINETVNYLAKDNVDDAMNAGNNLLIAYASNRNNSDVEISEISSDIICGLIDKVSTTDDAKMNNILGIYTWAKQHVGTLAENLLQRYFLLAETLSPEKRKAHTAHLEEKFPEDYALIERNRIHAASTHDADKSNAGGTLTGTYGMAIETTEIEHDGEKQGTSSQSERSVKAPSSEPT